MERSLNGCLEKYYRDGELVGEKRILDNKLGMAILRRLDRKAEIGLALHSNVPSAHAEVREKAPDWDLMLSALRSGDEGMIAEALVEAGKLEGDEVGEVADPPNRPPSGDNFESDEPDPRCWCDEEEECWMTDFPPPPDFSGYEQGRWGEEDYKRECTAEESRILAAALDAETAGDRAEDEAERDGWFAQLSAAIGGDGAAAILPEGDGEAGGDDGERDSEPDDRAPPA